MIIIKKRLWWFVAIYHSDEVLFNTVYNFSNAKSSLPILRPLHSEHLLSLRHPTEFGSRTWWDPNMNTPGRRVGGNISTKRSYTAENDRRHVNAVSSRNVGVKTARKWALTRRRGDATCIKLGGVCQPNSYICHDQYLRNKRVAAGSRCIYSWTETTCGIRDTMLQHMAHLSAPQSFLSPLLPILHCNSKVCWWSEGLRATVTLEPRGK